MEEEMNNRPFEYKPVSKEQFLIDNPFGEVYTDQDGPRRPLTQEEYDAWVEGSRGIWDDIVEE